MTNEGMTKALVAMLNRHYRATWPADPSAAGYLESLIGTLVELSPKVKKEVMSTLVYVTNNKE